MNYRTFMGLQMGLQMLILKHPPTTNTSSPSMTKMARMQNYTSPLLYPYTITITTNDTKKKKKKVITT